MPETKRNAPRSAASSKAAGKTKKAAAAAAPAGEEPQVPAPTRAAKKAAVRKRGLGRGLDALLGQAETTMSRAPLDRLKPNRRQPRTYFDEGDLEELAESIRTQGVVQPLVVTPELDGHFVIIAGERRWRAARRAGLTEVPIVVRQVADDRELLELALVENVQRADLNPLEEAEAYLMLQEDFGLSQEEVAQRVGKSRSAVTNSLRLLRLTPEVQDYLRDGRLTPGQVRPLIGADEDAQVEMAARAVEEGLSARDMERAMREPEPAPAAPEKKSTKAAPKTDVHTAAAEEELTRRLQTRVEIRRRRRGGEVRLHFHSEEELMRIYDHLMRKG